MTFGRTPLIQLSPKKTVEGFIGALFSTVLFSYLVCISFLGIGMPLIQSNFIVGYNLSNLSVFHLSLQGFRNVLLFWSDVRPESCFLVERRAVAGLAFVKSVYHSRLTKSRSWIWAGLDVLQSRQNIANFPWTPFQLHAIALAVFASLVAPFGGFFASGFKRAFNIKDFGDSIPGHGGMTDRMDCQSVELCSINRFWKSLNYPKLQVPDGNVQLCILCQLDSNLHGYHR